ncbi:MAG: hypothetical protein HY916_01600 [Desulfovibrio sp.]|jgi:hypothetical protein|nr:hypothetical protein [Desulfovibrio sp.]
MEQQGSMADRRSLRVAVPQPLFREAALWLRPAHTPTRLNLKELGRPDLVCPAGCGSLLIEDISATGLRLLLPRPEELGPGLALLSGAGGLPYLYLKLAQPLSAQEEQSLALLLAVEPVAASRTENGGLSVAVNILYRAQPDRDDKALTFFYVARYAIRELAAWCDEVARMDRAPARAQPRGLRMNRLLLELDALPGQEQNNAASEH